MKVVALNGSVHKKGNTYDLLNVALGELKSAGIKTELIQLAPLKIQACQACYKCAQKADGLCHGVKDDGLNEILPKIWEADGLLLGSPTWFSNVTGHMKNFIDRVGIVARVNGHLLTRKIGAPVVAVRRAGGIVVVDAINHFFFIQGMIVPGSVYWNVGIGREPGQCMQDDEGVETITLLGRNMAWLLKKTRE